MSNCLFQFKACTFINHLKSTRCIKFICKLTFNLCWFTTKSEFIVLMFWADRSSFFFNSYRLPLIAQNIFLKKIKILDKPDFKMDAFRWKTLWAFKLKRKSTHPYQNQIHLRFKQIIPEYYCAATMLKVNTQTVFFRNFEFNLNVILNFVCLHRVKYFE